MPYSKKNGLCYNTRMSTRAVGAHISEWPFILNTTMKFICKTHWIVSCLLIISLFDLTIHPASAIGSTLQLKFRNNRLSISADEADIQTVLLRVSEETGIHFYDQSQWPRTIYGSNSTHLNALLQLNAHNQERWKDNNEVCIIQIASDDVGGSRSKLCR